MSDTCPRAYIRVGLLVWLCSLLLAGCGGVQSSLSPAGRAAEDIATLFWWMAVGTVIIWIGVLILAVSAVRARPDIDRRRQSRQLIIAGALTPAIVLGGLLIYGLGMLPGAIARAPEGSLRITVSGEQWWWRVRYEPPGKQPFEAANEVRLPVGEPVEFLLHSNNVIHSFWIPSLGGKVDMIPGRTNRLSLHPTKTGSFRGACAEFCGRGHANMAFDAIVLTKAEFTRWLDHQSQEAAQLPAAAETKPAAVGTKQ